MINSNRVYRFLILSVCMVVPFSVDIFISGLPDIERQFVNQPIGLVLSMTLFGVALSQLIYGPLLDRFGRKVVLLCGLSLYTLASVVITVSNSFELLIISRFLQAVGGCSGIVAVFAIVKDTYDKEQMMPIIGTIMAMIGASPVLAPLIGSYLNNALGWRASFGFLVLLGATYLVIISLLFTETLKEKNLTALKMRNIIGNYYLLAKTPNFLTYSLVSGLTYCILFSYLNVSAFFIIEQMHYSKVGFGWIVASNAVTIIIMAKIAPVFVKKIGTSQTVIIGLLLITSGGLAMLASNLNNNTTIITFMLPMLITTAGGGIIRPTANVGAMQTAPKSVAGSASGLFNFVTFGLGAIASSLSLQVVHSVLEFSLGIIICGCLALLLVKFTLLNNVDQRLDIA